MFPDIKRSNGGIRIFSQKEIDTLRIIDCLKTTGMSIKEIKEFLGWCQEGDSSLQKRREMFYNRLEKVKKQIETLENTMSLLKYKCWYYETACQAGTEDVVRSLLCSEVPSQWRTLLEKLHPDSE